MSNQLVKTWNQEQQTAQAKLDIRGTTARVMLTPTQRRLVFTAPRPELGTELICSDDRLQPRDAPTSRTPGSLLGRPLDEAKAYRDAVNLSIGFSHLNCGAARAAYVKAFGDRQADDWVEVNKYSDEQTAILMAKLGCRYGGQMGLEYLAFSLDFHPATAIAIAYGEFRPLTVSAQFPVSFVLDAAADTPEALTANTEKLLSIAMGPTGQGARFSVISPCMLLLVNDVAKNQKLVAMLEVLTSHFAGRLRLVHVIL